MVVHQRVTEVTSIKFGQGLSLAYFWTYTITIITLTVKFTITTCTAKFTFGQSWYFAYAQAQIQSPIWRSKWQKQGEGPVVLGHSFSEPTISLKFVAHLPLHLCLQSVQNLGVPEHSPDQPNSSEVQEPLVPPE